MSLDMGVEFFPTDLLLEEDRKTKVAEVVRKEFGLTIPGLSDIIIDLQDSMTGKSQRLVSEVENKRLAEKYAHLADLAWICTSIGKILGSWEDLSPLGSESLSAVEAKARFVTLLTAIQEMMEYSD